MRKLVLLTVALLSINLAFGQSDQIDEYPVLFGCEDLQTEEERFNCLQEKILDHIATNVEYPELARQMGIQGKVIVVIVIENNGEVNEVKVSQGVDELLDNEAIRVMKLLPKFIPAQKDGQSVRFELAIPINFNLDAGDEDSAKDPLEELSFLEFIISESAETEHTSSLEAYTFEKGNTAFLQTMRIVNDEEGWMTSIRLSKGYHTYNVLYDFDGLDTVAIDTIRFSRDPVLLSFPYPVTQEEAFNSTHRIDTTYVDGRRRNKIILDTVFTGHKIWVNVEEYMELTYLEHTADTLYLEVDVNSDYYYGLRGRSLINYHLNDFQPLFNLNCSFREIIFERLIWDIKYYSGEEIVVVDDELLTVKLKDDLLYFNIDAAKSISDSYIFYEVYGNELITAYQEKLMLPSDLPKDIAVKLIPSSTIKNLKPIEYAFDIEPIKEFLEEKTSW